MWTKSYSKIYQDVKKEEIWRIWMDVNNWPKWDKELEYCKMTSSFTNGNQFILKPRGGPEVKIILSDLVPNQKFTDYCNFFGATMYDHHELEETPHGLLIKNTITMKGLLSSLWVQLVAKNLVNSLPKQMDALVEFARAQHA